LWEDAKRKKGVVAILCLDKKPKSVDCRITGVPEGSENTRKTLGLPSNTGRKKCTLIRPPLSRKEGKRKRTEGDPTFPLLLVDSQTLS